MPKAPGHERARPDPAVLLHRTAGPATPSQPANGRLLPGHPAALLGFVERETGKAPSALDINDVGAGVISAFLDHLETERHNTPRTRNARLGAIRSLFRYAALRHPEHAELIAQVLAIPQKRFARAAVSFLTPAEFEALLAAPDLTTWEGRRDRALILLGAQTGLRVSEIIGLNRGDVRLGVGAHVRCEGKGRKQRAVLLTGPVQAVLREGRV